MRKICLLTLSIVLLINNAYSQKLKKEQVFDDKARTSLTYYVLKEKPEIKQGSYIYKFKGNVQVTGQFENNQQGGEWIYTPGKELKIKGNYSNGKKDGVWEYYMNEHLISVMNYKNGLLHGLSKGYFENGQQAREINYKYDEKDGVEIFYFENGAIEKTIDFKKGKMHGSYKSYSEKNGELLFEIKYTESVPYDLSIYTSDKENILYDGDLKNGTGKFIEYFLSFNGRDVTTITNYKDYNLNGQAEFYINPGEIYMRGQYKDGFLIGMWDFEINNPEKKYSKVYNFSDSISEDSIIINQINSIGSFYQIVDKMPKFNNGTQDQFKKHIEQTLVYPSKALKKGISGRVVTQFKINKFGLVYDIKVEESVHELLDKEAIRVIKSSPLWTPGFQDQLPVDVSFTFPISFQL